MTLTAAFVKSVRRQGGRTADRYGDGRGLVLQVMPSGSKQWRQRLALNGTRRASAGSPWTRWTRARCVPWRGALEGGLSQRASTAMIVADGRHRCRRRRRPSRARPTRRGAGTRTGTGASPAARRTHRVAPVRRGRPAWRFMRDGDGDGVVCERRRGQARIAGKRKTERDSHGTQAEMANETSSDRFP